jgi:hypothetical protein
MMAGTLECSPNLLVSQELPISGTLKENSYDLAISQFALNSRKAMANSEYQHKLWFLETGGHTNLTGLSGFGSIKSTPLGTLGDASLPVVTGQGETGVLPETISSQSASDVQTPSDLASGNPDGVTPPDSGTLPP